MEDKTILDYIHNEIENEFLDFKLIIYDWKDKKSKCDFITDVIALSNSNSIGDKYIITGVKVKPTGERVIKGINICDVKDSAVYQEIISENVEPSLSIDFKVIEDDDLHFGIFRIYNCSDRPYMLKKKYEDLESGYMKYRRGSRNTNLSRYVLDSIYNAKQPSLESNFKIDGIVNGNISDEVILYKYDFFPNLDKIKDDIVKKVNGINNFVIDDIFESNSNNVFVGFAKGFLCEKEIEISNDVKDNIKEFVDVIGIELNSNFYDIGNAKTYMNGFSSANSILGQQVDYKETGSKKSLEKYHSIIKLGKDVQRLIGWASFVSKIENLSFLQLAISEIGTHDDEEINVSIEIPKGIYMDFDSFPQIYVDIIDEFDTKYSRKTFMPEYNNKISDFRVQPSSSVQTLPNSFSFPFVNSRIGNINSYYDYVDYDVLDKGESTIISFTIKNLKVGETMVFPGNIILSDKIDGFNYSIISKNTKSKIMGYIEIK